MSAKIAILDAGAQYLPAIAMEIAERGYNADTFPLDVSFDKISDYDAIFISGGPDSVYRPGAILPDPDVYYSDIPTIGICFGMQSIAHQLGGKVEEAPTGQYGRAYMNIIKDSPLFRGLSPVERVLMSHRDVVVMVPDEFEVSARSDGMIAAIQNRKRKIYGVQCHPEMRPVTTKGGLILDNFLYDICGFPKAEGAPISEETKRSMEYIMSNIGENDHILLPWSSGVDSSVVYSLLSNVIPPDRFHVRYFDTGAMREGETRGAIDLAQKMQPADFKVLYVKDRFYNPLKYVIDPKKKRALFGEIYAAIAVEEMDNIAVEYNVPKERIIMADGSIAPDIIESAKKAHLRNTTKAEITDEIKKHHNMADELDNVPRIMPLSRLFKKQVRAIAREQGLYEIADKQPCPGPSLYVRIVGSNGQFSIDEGFAELADVVGSKAHRYGFDGVSLPVKTVGVQGDSRTHKYAAMLSGEPDWNNYLEASLALPNEIGEINRVFFSLGDSPDLQDVCTLTPTYNTHKVMDQARKCDSVMRSIASEYGYMSSDKCSQLVGYLMPLGLGKKGCRTFVIRPVYTHNFMCLVGMTPHENIKSLPPLEQLEHIPEEMFFRMADEIPRKVDGVAEVVLDSTWKPSASTEAE